MKDFPLTTDLYSEKTASQQPALDLLQSMGYTYISPQDCEAQRGSRYHVLLKDILRGQLRRLNRYTFAGAENEFSAATLNEPWTIWTNLSQMVWCAPVKRSTMRCFWAKATQRPWVKGKFSASTCGISTGSILKTICSM